MSTPPRTITVTQDEDGQRLDRWLKKHLPGVPYTLVQKLIRKGQIRADGKRVKPDTRIAAGQQIKLPSPGHTDESAPKMPKTIRITPDDIRFMRDMIIYEDSHIIALNKPHDLATQGGTKIRRHIDGLLPALADKNGVVPRLVHRLDKETSGILLLARTADAARKLGESFKKRTVRKLYWALLSPVPETPEGTIKAPIAKSGGNFEKMCIDEEDGKYALTEYVVLEHAGDAAAFVAFWPRTGRTHQIRVHAAHVLGAPVIGEHKYKAPKDPESKKPDADLGGMKLAKRLHLHARRVILPHPIQAGHMLDITAPLPQELVQSWKQMGFNHKYKADPFEHLD